MKQKKRICINPKDVQLITGRSERQGRRMINEVKKCLGKTGDELLTIKEFCEAKGLPVDTVINLLDN